MLPRVLAARLRRAWPVTLTQAAAVLFAASLLPAAALTSAAGTPSRIAAPSVLEPVVEDLKTVCGCDTLRVEWRGLEGIWRTASKLDCLSLASPLPSESGEQDVDRVVLRLRGTRGGSPVEVLLSGDVLCLSSVYLARRSLRQGDVLGPGDVEMSYGWFSPSVVRGQGEEITGLYLLRSVSAGAPLGKADLRTPPLVRRGALVRVIYASDALQVEGRGTARLDGWEGDRVRVRVAGAERDCEGVVTAPGMIRVRGEGGR